ncbi:MAG: hypothetical protein JO336_13460, partial [Acidobacteriia bacterium]|nr:hypothetical protein [Terriglobia bacterium]MBV8907166.1 hypothetical protein [Terriglobia bacterium]
MVATRDRLIALSVLVASFVISARDGVGQTTAPVAAAPDPHRAFLSTYCFTCHNSRAKIGGVALDSLDLNTATDDARTWEKAIRKLRGRLMPPPGNPQPPQKDVDSFV